MDLNEWNQWNATRLALWGVHRAPMPDVPTLLVSLPVVAGIDFEEALQWMNRLAENGEKFAPAAADLVAAFRARGQVAVPTFDEAFELTFGRGSRLLSRSATAEDFDAVHPLVASWVKRSGIERLRVLPVFDPQYGELRRADLRRSWEAHVEAFEGRERVAAGLPPGDRERGLERMDPLATLGLDRKQIGAGDDA